MVGRAPGASRGPGLEKDWEGARTAPGDVFSVSHEEMEERL